MRAILQVIPSMTPSQSFRGFTLIELLVVVAIIALLSVVVFGSLGLGRLKAADAAVKSNMNTIRTSMEVYFSDNNSYGTTVSQSSASQVGPTTVGSHVFASNPTINNAMKEAIRQGGYGYWSVGPNGGTWAVAVKLKAESGYWWCIDHNGQPKREQDGTQISISGNTIGGGTTAAACP